MPGEPCRTKPSRGGHNERPPAGAGPLDHRLGISRRRAGGAGVRQPRLAASVRPRHRRDDREPGEVGLASRRIRSCFEWLACRFVADGRRLKPLLKLMVMSAAYRQASAAATETAQSAMAADPGNRLLWHMPLRRIEAEIVRDAILGVSGRLEPGAGRAAAALGEAARRIGRDSRGRTCHPAPACGAACTCWRGATTTCRYSTSSTSRPWP